MDSKITMSFNADVIQKAKKFADSRNISLSRLTELIYRKMLSGHYASLEDFPIADWVNEIAEGDAVYKTKAKSRRLPGVNTTNQGNEYFPRWS